MGSSILPQADVEAASGTDVEGELGSISRELPVLVGTRYRVEAEIGRGGMAVVYRAVDSASGEQLALKRLLRTGSERYDAALTAAFEREFHTLVQLSHPRIIEVYDFGSDSEHGAYYTMELLEGGDLRERAPLDWRKACAVVYDVCSSLALLHARRFVHRDVSPRNVRTTREGKAKLIDFGALAPMGTCGQAIGTPPFVAPEVLHRSTLDARTDLFSLGATLYYALTRRFCYPARDFASLRTVWAQRPAPPSTITPSIPRELDALVMSLISLDPAARPRSAFEVMQRLAAVAQLGREASDVSQAYLSAPTLVGRDALLADLGRSVRRAVAGRGHAHLIRGDAGVGRTRVLDACALDAKISGAVVLRINGAENGEAFAVGASLAAQLMLALPEQALASARSMAIDALLFEPPAASAVDTQAHARPTLKKLAGSSVDLQALQPKLTAWLLRLADVHSLAILVDDVQQVDEASLALLASLALGAPRRRMFVLVTAEAGTERAAATDSACAALQRACTPFELPLLSRDEVDALVISMFGDVPSLALISERLYQAAAGNPRDTLEIVQALIARDVVRYADGQWHLPEQLAANDVPSSALERCKARIAELSPLARRVAETQALASHSSMSQQEYALIAGEVPAGQLEAAISELVGKGLLVGDGQVFALARREWASVLDAGLDDVARLARHRSLAELYAAGEGRVIERALHLFACGSDGAALDLLVPSLENATTSFGVLVLTSMRATKVAEVLDRGLDSAIALGRLPREIHELRRAVFAISIMTDEARYYRAAPVFLDQVKRDSGLFAYERITDVADPMQRLMQALTEAQASYAAAPEHERVLSVEAAIKALAYYVAISIAIGARAQDHALIASLPALLEPYTALSPLLHAMWQNALATYESICANRAEHARTRWLEVDAALAKVSVAEMNYVEQLRGAIAYGIATIEARLGISSAEATAKTLDSDPLQRASAMSLRRVARLHKGDFTNAERYRKQAELIALHGNQRQMFTSTLVAELNAHAIAGDLAGIHDARQAIALQAARFSGWRGYLFLADGYFELTRGQLEAAREAFERGLELSRPDANDASRCTGAWLRLEAGCMDALVGLGRAEEARAAGLATLERCAELGIDLPAFVVRRALALSEAKLGDYAAASARLERVIEELRAYDIEGLELGAAYEARARVAIWASDRDAAEHFGRLTAQEYRYGQDSPLGARYERLWDEARIAGVAALPELEEMKSSMTTSHQRSASWTVDGYRSLRPATLEQAFERACQRLGASSGHLYRKTECGFELVASHGDGEADPAFQQLISSRSQIRPLDEDDVTRIETDVPHATGELCDRRGVAYRTTLLMSERSCAGALVIDAGSRFPTQALLSELLEVLTDSSQVEMSSAQA